MATTRKLSAIVTEICTRLNDADIVKYADSTTYIGRASVYFNRAVRDILESPKLYRIDDFDFRGVLELEEIAVGAGTEDDGIINFSDLNHDIKEIRDIYTNSDSSNDQLPYNTVRINETYPEYAENIESKEHYFADPIINTSLDRGWYVKGTTIQFYPKSGTGDQEYYVTVEYVKETSPDDYDKDTEFYVGATGGLFTLKFIDKAIDLAVAKLLAERNV